MTVQLTPEARAACERLGADPDAVAENIAAHLRTAPTCEEYRVSEVPASDGLRRLPPRRPDDARAGEVAQEHSPRASLQRRTLAVGAVAVGDEVMSRTYDPRSVTISVDGDIIPHALSRSDVLAEARRALLSGRILIRSEVDFGVDLSRYFGPSIMDGDRGCFHDGCDAAVAQEGGSHWCKLVRWGPLVPLVPPPTPATPG